jgi:hypothetical protein
MSDLLRYGPPDDLPHPGEADHTEVSRLHAACKPASPWLAGDEREIAQLFEIVGSALSAPFGSGLRLLDFRHETAAYLSFPLLEAMLKKWCSAFVNYDGTAVQQWDAPDLRHKRVYDKNKRKRPYDQKTRPCSSIQDLLFLLCERIAPANPELKADLDAVRSYLQTLCPQRDPFNTVYWWRNQSLHGQRFAPLGRIVWSIALLLALFLLRPSFEARRSGVQAMLRFRQNTGHHRPFTFYFDQLRSDARP